jgi:hypothetical protein
MTRRTRRWTATGGWTVESYGPIWSTRVWIATWPLPVAGILLTDTIPAKTAVVAAFAVWSVVVAVWSDRENVAWCDLAAPEDLPDPCPVEVLVVVEALDAVAGSPAETEPAPARPSLTGRPPALALEARTR